MKWLRVVVVGAVFLATGFLGATSAFGAGELAPVVEDGFTGSDNDPWNPAIWTDDDLANGHSTIQDNEGQLEVTGSTNALARQLADGIPHTDFEAVFKQRFAGGFNEDKRFGFEFRRSSEWSSVNRDAPLTGYQLHHQQGINRIRLYRFDSDGTATPLATSGGIDRTKTYWFRVRAEGDSIRVRWWEVGMSEPANWNFDITEGTYLTGQAFSFTHWRGNGSGTRQAIIDDLVVDVLGVINNPPVTADDAYATDEDTQLVVAAPGVLGNDSDADGDSLTAVLQGGPADGSVNFNANGGFTYTPDSGFSGMDSFTYQASDGHLSATATVTITVNAAGNVPPVAADDAYATDEDTQLVVAAPGVLGNDTDADGDSLTAVLQTGPADGSVNFNANGGFTYTPDTGFSGTDSFTYRANDGLVDSSVATVTITVNAAGNVPPVAADDAYVTDEGERLVVAAPGVLGNDTDADGDRLRAVLVAGPANGNVKLKSNGGFTYAPAAGFSGTDSFTYRARGGIANSNVAKVTVTVNATPDP